jgi:hypothetical protein
VLLKMLYDNITGAAGPVLPNSGVVFRSAGHARARAIW